MQRGSRKNRLLDYWVGTPLLNLLATFHRKRKIPGQIQKIGVMCSPALGDTLLFSAVLQDLRSQYPSTPITHLCMRQNQAAAEIIPGADHRILIGLTQPLEAVRVIREQHFDVLLDFSSWQRLTAFFTLTSGARYTAGFRTQGMNRSRGYDLVVEHTRDRHEVDNFRALLAGSGMVSPSTILHEPAVSVPDGPTPFAGEEVVVFHPWASGQKSWLREWPDDLWVALAQRLSSGNTLFVLTGAPSDQPRMAALLERLHATGLRAEPFVSPDGFVSLTRLLRHARVVVSVNTGVMHLAAVAGAATVSLNGPTAEHRWGARGARVANVRPADGSGGYLHLGFEFKGQAADIMPRISVDQVVCACESVMRAVPAEVL